ncbi:MAG: hypothetical protein WC483_00255 [Candidatus Paceibacterota bacterium]
MSSRTSKNRALTLAMDIVSSMLVPSLSRGSDIRDVEKDGSQDASSRLACRMDGDMRPL